GRQHLARRPGRRPDTDAVDARSQRRVLDLRPRAPDAPGRDGRGLRLPGHERRGAAGQQLLAAALDPADDRGAQAEPGLQPGRLHRPRRLQPERPVVQPGLRRGHRAMRQQPLPVSPAGGARPAPVRGPAAGGAARRGALPADRRAAVPADARPARVLLVPARGGAAVTLDAAVGMLADWLPHQRWFAGKDRPIDSVRVVACTTLREADPVVRHLLVEVVQGADAYLYQVPLALRTHPEDKLAHVLLGETDEGFVYDALHDKTAMADVLERFVRQDTVGGLRFV